MVEGMILTPKTRVRVLVRSIRRGITLAALAREANVDPSLVCHVIAGRKSSRHVRAVICRRLGFRPRQIGWPQQVGKPEFKRESKPV
jgi:lambda repressor-like predicted transcriptional regulator